MRKSGVKFNVFWMRSPFRHIIMMAQNRLFESAAINFAVVDVDEVLLRLLL